MICDMCGANKARVRRVTRSDGHGLSLLVIVNVPVVSCSRCGECHLTAETLHRIELIKHHREVFARERSVTVAAFGQP